MLLNGRYNVTRLVRTDRQIVVATHSCCLFPQTSRGRGENSRSMPKALLPDGPIETRTRFREKHAWCVCTGNKSIARSRANSNKNCNKSSASTFVLRIFEGPFCGTFECDLNLILDDKLCRQNIREQTSERDIWTMF